MRLVPDSPTVCLGVNETTRKGGGKKEGKKTKETERKGHGGEKVTALLAAI